MTSAKSCPTPLAWTARTSSNVDWLALTTSRSPHEPTITRSPTEETIIGRSARPLMGSNSSFIVTPSVLANQRGAERSQNIPRAARSQSQRGARPAHRAPST